METCTDRTSMHSHDPTLQFDLPQPEHPFFKKHPFYYHFLLTTAHHHGHRHPPSIFSSVFLLFQAATHRPFLRPPSADQEPSLLPGVVNVLLHRHLGCPAPSLEVDGDRHHLREPPRARLVLRAARPAFRQALAPP